MAKGLNDVKLMGHLVRDVEVRFTPTKQKRATFTLAVNDDYKNKATGELVKDTDFLDCVAWGSTADVVEKYAFAKGTPLLVSGRMKKRGYEAKDGTKRYSVFVQVDKVFLISHSKANDGTVSGGGATDELDGIYGAGDVDVPF